MNLFSGFVGLLGDNGSWAYTHWVLRRLVCACSTRCTTEEDVYVLYLLFTCTHSYIALELVEGLGFDAKQFDELVLNPEFQVPNWQRVGCVAFQYRRCVIVRSEPYKHPLRIGFRRKYVR